MTDSPPDPVVAASLLVGRAAGLVLQHLESRDVHCLLLKGASLAGWLYAPGERQFMDTDVLVPRAELSAALAALEELGYRPALGEASAWEQDGHSITLVRAESNAASFGEVDLHFSLPGVPDAVDPWPLLASHRCRLQLGNRNVPALDNVGKALTVCLHVARDGKANEQALEDLRRCLSRLHDADWQAVARLADSLLASPALARGLELGGADADLLGRLHLTAATSVEMELRRADAPPLAYGFERWSQLTPADRVRSAARELWPSAGFLRHWSELTKRPPARPVWRLRLERVGYLVAKLPRAWLVWRRARRSG